ncbi:MAG: glycosyltransferase [Planctomycetota bacterium]
MRVLHICDRMFAVRETEMLSRLRIGMADEGVRLALFLPDSVLERTEDVLTGQVIAYPTGGTLLGRKLRTRRMAEAAEAALGGEAPDIIHAFGGASWGVAESLAERVGARLVLEAWRVRLGPRVRMLRHWQKHARSERGGPVLAAPWRSIDRELRREISGASVRYVPWGVHPKPARKPRREDGPLGIVLMGGRRASRDAESAARATLELARDRDDVLLFADAETAAAVRLWKLANELGVRDRVSVAEDLEVDRRLVTRMDALVYAGRPGEARTLLLDAMAAGLTVLAQQDENNESLRDGETAIIVGDANGQTWDAALARAMDEEGLGERLGASSARWVATERRASSQVAALLDAYESAVTPSPGPAAAVTTG